jgi:hypothetical protein
VHRNTNFAGHRSGRSMTPVSWAAVRTLNASEITHGSTLFNLTCSSDWKSEDSRGGLRRCWGASCFIAPCPLSGGRTYRGSSGTAFAIPPTFVGGV